MFGRATNGYVRLSGALLHKSAFALVLLLAFGAAGLWIGGKVPTSFVPDEDQGYFYLNVQLPNAASLQRTEEVITKIEEIVLKTPGVEHFTSVMGFSLLSQVRTSYNAFVFVSMKEWSDRKSAAEQFQAIKANLNRELSKLPEAVAFGFSPPAIPGVGTSGGFTFILEDRSGSDVKFLSDNLNTFMAAARKRPEIGSLSTTYLPSVPQQFVTVDRDKVIKQGVAINDVYRTIQAFMGGLFINYFNRFGRQWQVYVEAEGDYRTKSENVGQFYVRNAAGEMVPLSALTKFEFRNGPEFTMRFNEYRSAQLNGGAAPGYSTNQAMKALEEVFAQSMPPEMGFDYSGMSFQEKKAQEGVSPGVIFGFSLLFVFLILAALYESWTLPFSVLLSTPVAVFGAFGVLWLRRTLLGYFAPPYMVQIENDVYSQIGLVMLIGLAAKNAILIVEFAKDEFEKGKPLADAALEGARLRLRPILMTSFAFILGMRAFVDRDRSWSGGPADHGNHGNRRDGGRQRDRHLPDSRDLLSGREAIGCGCAETLRSASPRALARTGRLIDESPDPLDLSCRRAGGLHGGSKLQTPGGGGPRYFSRPGAAAAGPSRFARRPQMV